jgi:hypothetical protein
VIRNALDAGVFWIFSGDIGQAVKSEKIGPIPFDKGGNIGRGGGKICSLGVIFWGGVFHKSFTEKDLRYSPILAWALLFQRTIPILNVGVDYAYPVCRCFGQYACPHCGAGAA